MGVPIMTMFQRDRLLAFDTSLVDGAIPELVLDQLRHAVCVDVQNVRDAYSQGIMERALDAATCPWPSAFFEFTVQEHGFLIGVLVRAFPVDDVPLHPGFRGGKKGDTFHDCVLFQHNKAWHPHNPPIMAGVATYCTNAAGEVILSHNGGGLMTLYSIAGEESEDSLEGMRSAMQVVICAIAFANCKNVEQVEEESPYPSRQARRAAERRGEPKPPRFYTLRINPNAMRKQSEGSGVVSGRELSLHIVRGHFATYTEERKLFGKHAGTFWVPAHVRGSQDVGVVGKDYEIVSGK